MIIGRIANSYTLENTRGHRVEERRGGQSNAEILDIISDPAFGQLST